MKTSTAFGSCRCRLGSVFLGGFYLPCLALAAASDEPVTLAPVEVTGSLIKWAEDEPPAPVKIITREDIDLSGRASFSQLIADLPEAGFSNITEAETNGYIRGASALSLQGFGVGNTLILVDGRRAATGGSSFGGTAFVDLNRYPSAMVERVEILHSSGAIYGSGGTAGVMNVILRKDFTGSELRVRYGNSFRTDVAERSFSFITGASTPRASLTASFSYDSCGALRGSDLPFSRSNDLSDRYEAMGPQNAARVASGYFDLRSYYGPIARVSLVAGQVNGANGVAIPGLAAGTRISYLPGTGGLISGRLSIASVNFTTPAVFGTGGSFNAQAAATFVAQNIAARGTNSNRFENSDLQWLSPSKEQIGFGLTYRRNLTPHLAAYARFGFQANRSHIELGPLSFSPDVYRVPRTNYWNPFGVDVIVYYQPLDIGPDRTNSNDRTGTFLCGLRGTIGRRWIFDTAYSFALSQNTEKFYDGWLSPERVREALARTTPNAYNVFGGAGFRNDPQTIATMLSKQGWRGEAQQHAWDAKISGEAFTLPSGPVGVAVLAEMRAERAAEWPYHRVQEPVMGGAEPASATIWQIVEALAAEVRVPLVRRDTRRWLYNADLSLAGRFDNYDGRFDSGLVPYAGLRVQPVRSLTLRASASESFVAPALQQSKWIDVNASSTSLADMRRPQTLTGDPFDGTTTSRTVRIQGNPNVGPAYGKSSQVGLVFDIPGRLLKGLTLGATYSRLSEHDGIRWPGATYMLDNEVGGGTAEFVIRDPGTESYTNRTNAPISVLAGPAGQLASIAPGETVTVPGRIQYIKNAFLNMRDMRKDTWNFWVAYARASPRLGRVRMSSRATYDDFFGQSVGFARMLNLAGGSPYPRVKIRSSLVWYRGVWHASVAHNYIGPYGTLARSPYVEVDPYSAIDTQIGWSVRNDAKRWLGGVRLTLGVDNVFDREPPLDFNSGGYGYHGYRASLVRRPVGRFFYAEVKKTY